MRIEYNETKFSLNLKGGVHRDGNVTMDVSADLIELGRNPVAVVASGVKSILDIPKTLEFLVSETHHAPRFLNSEIRLGNSRCVCGIVSK